MELLNCMWGCPGHQRCLDFQQEYWSGLPFPSPGDLPDSGIEPGSPVQQAGSLPSEPPGKYAAWKLIIC